MATIIRRHSNAMNKQVAKSLREQYIRPIKAIGRNHKPMFRAQRKDAGTKRK